MRKQAWWLWLLLAAPLAQAACPPLLDYRVPRLTGGSTDLCQYQDKTIVVVNTASKCGFTPQFAQLQTLWQQYRSRGVVVLGFPSDDFFQELEQAKDIAEFCHSNYGVDFPMMSRISVRGSNAHPFYQALASADAVLQILGEIAPAHHLEGARRIIGTQSLDLHRHLGDRRLVVLGVTQLGSFQHFHLQQAMVHGRNRGQGALI